MKVLVLNSGSSSIKFQLFRNDDWTVLASGSVTRIGEPEALMRCRWADAEGTQQRLEDCAAIPDHQQGLQRIAEALAQTGALADTAELLAVGHRVVHGGEAFHAPTLVDDDIIEVIRQVIPLAPLHNPANLDGILVARKLFPTIPQVAVFDTAFHQTMPRTAYRYAIPDFLYREHGVRRYGFHGTSHHYVGRRAAELLGKPFEQCNLITLHLGNGASATAIREGSSVDTSMGMTPLEGLVMGTRSGDIDPAVPFYLSKHLGLDNDTLEGLLNRQSGLLGLCGDNDLREIQRRAEAGDEAAELALGVTAHRLKKYIGAYLAELGRTDALVFTGGIGENSAELRARACAGLETLGIRIDAAANTAASQQERAVSHAESPIQVLVIPTNEELQIAREAVEAVEAVS
ncbi:acetate kinase [Lamprobacter modestohalophilus]|uniref:acetate/propionate family kinase n=1 Tax=Lamprobacter modestohalophilus TaxID=1064514 RepID=UPI002ADEEBB1|nr:acetate kinase [Lamprobacter modestohalophilus]MEA1050339.1 acetate kinase [Lamprobacter modestohalophilus]